MIGSGESSRPATNRGSSARARMALVECDHRGTQDTDILALQAGLEALVIGDLDQRRRVSECSSTRSACRPAKQPEGAGARPPCRGISAPSGFSSKARKIMHRGGLEQFHQPWDGLAVPPRGTRRVDRRLDDCFVGVAQEPANLLASYRGRRSVRGSRQRCAHFQAHRIFESARVAQHRKDHLLPRGRRQNRDRLPAHDRTGIAQQRDEVLDLRRRVEIVFSVAQAFAPADRRADDSRRRRTSINGRRARPASEAETSDSRACTSLRCRPRSSCRRHPRSRRLGESRGRGW